MRDLTLRLATVAVALTDLERGVREERPNWSPRIDEYFKNLDPPIIISTGGAGVPWCAAAVQYWLDIGTLLTGTQNPFDDVKLEAYVQSYVSFAKADPRVSVLPEGEIPKAGDLFAIYFRTLKRYAHIGLVLHPEAGTFRTVEGNSNDDGSREGVAVVSRRRSYNPSTIFLRYGDD